jgi:ADP-ribosyl-[dinitrogen reductase] hydrolase
MHPNKAADTLMGLCVGDALGVPVEFKSRNTLSANPVTGMQGYGTHNQPAGTWSDDSSLAFCLAESLCKGYDLEDIANTIVRWYTHKHWTPHGKVFDIGGTTYRAIQRLKNDESPLYSGDFDEEANGNGSLMRILPLIFYLKDKPIEERYQVVKEVSSITHAHFRSVISCFIYIEYALLLLKGRDKKEAYKQMQDTVNEFIKISYSERKRFDRVLLHHIESYFPAEISGSGYVLHTLEASLWCFLNTDSYKEAVLKAVNLGEDTDTTGCVTGGLAGLYYGFEAIPAEWVDVIARKEDILALADKLHRKYEATT